SVFSFPTPTKTGIPVRHTRIITINGLNHSEPVVSFAQGYAYQGGLEVDAMMGLINDIFRGAELVAPLYTHDFFSGIRTVSFDASALPRNFAPDPVQYYVGATTSLMAMQEGMEVYGAACTSSNQDHW
ncbi:unnamed protein product, partial [Rotaria magnacalcarata]